MEWQFLRSSESCVLMRSRKRTPDLTHSFFILHRSLEDPKTIALRRGRSLISHGDTRLCPSRSLVCRSRRRLMEMEGGQEGGSEAGVGGRKRGGAGGARGEISDRCGALDVALRA